MHVMRPKNSITFMTFVKIEMDIVKTETLAKIVIIKPLGMGYTLHIAICN